jgi:hypothetical protein
MSDLVKTVNDKEEETATPAYFTHIHIREWWLKFWVPSVSYESRGTCSLTLPLSLALPIPKLHRTVNHRRREACSVGKPASRLHRSDWRSCGASVTTDSIDEAVRHGMRHMVLVST